MLPFPGDWHILYNYQKVLLKIYGDAGLLQLAKVAGHRSETLKSLAQASHFKRTHHFILQSFEAIYCLFLRLYLHSLETTPEAPPSQIPPSQATPLSANPQVPTSPEVGTLQYIPVWNSVSVWYGCYSNLRKCNLYCANDCLHTLLGSCGSDI